MAPPLTWDILGFPHRMKNTSYLSNHTSWYSSNNRNRALSAWFRKWWKCYGLCTGAGSPNPQERWWWSFVLLHPLNPCLWSLVRLSIRNLVLFIISLHKKKDLDSPFNKLKKNHLYKEPRMLCVSLCAASGPLIFRHFKRVAIFAL